MNNIWQLQEAKAKFSKIVNEATTRGPQIITKHGKETVLIISIKDYYKGKNQVSKLSDFFKESPLKNINLDLNRSKDLSREIEI